MKKNAIERNVRDCDPHLVASLHDQVKDLKTQLNSLRQQVNETSKKLGKLNAQQKNIDKNDTERISDISKDIQALQTTAKIIKDEIKLKSASLSSMEEELITEAHKIPNMTHPESPIGDESNAFIAYQSGNLLKLAHHIDQQGNKSKDIKIEENINGNLTQEFKQGDKNSRLQYKDNSDLCESLDIADFQTASKVSGSRFHYWKGYGVFLEFALIQYTLQKAVQYGFIPYMTPELVRSSIVDGCGFRPRPSLNTESSSKNLNQPEPSQIYRVEPVALEERSIGDDPLCLIATSEIPLTAIYSEEILHERSHKRTISPNVSKKSGINNDNSETVSKAYGHKETTIVDQLKKSPGSWFGNGKIFAEYANWQNLYNLDEDYDIDEEHKPVEKPSKSNKTSELPIGLAGFSHCYRSEAGSRGKDTKGLYRLHQFSKVELVVFTPSGTLPSSPKNNTNQGGLQNKKNILETDKDTEPNERGIDISNAALDYLVSFQKDIFESLGLTIRILDMPSQELGASAYRKYDIEAFMPGRGNWGEVSSASNCTDYQSRRLDIRYRPSTLSSANLEKNSAKPVESGDISSSGGNRATEFVHTLNATACAIPRTVAAILETHQQADGSVRIPKVLWPWMSGIRVLR
ncbi:hypothetical protein BB558_003061 [Smittium angustum]|uniref:serine--tRNA ligase n=1 Tax=Smittium angustum TaxID=133377 RepID=A0A2U1J731_SMIAN|nr:hypothetical protein BB558_003061 [Smittium angustum]